MFEAMIIANLVVYGTWQAADATADQSSDACTQLGQYLLFLASAHSALLICTIVLTAFVARSPSSASADVDPALGPDRLQRCCGSVICLLFIVILMFSVAASVWVNDPSIGAA